MGLLRICGLIALQLIGLSGTISNVKFWSLKGEEVCLSNLFQWTMMRISCIAHVSLRLVSYAFLSGTILE